MTAPVDVLADAGGTGSALEAGELIVPALATAGFFAASLPSFTSDRSMPPPTDTMTLSTPPMILIRNGHAFRRSMLLERALEA